MLLGKNLENISKIDIQTEGLRREKMPASFVKIKCTFIVEGDINARRFWKAIRLGHKKYCAVSDSLKSEMIYNLKLNGEEIPENAL